MERTLVEMQVREQYDLFLLMRAVGACLDPRSTSTPGYSENTHPYQQFLIKFNY